MNDGVVKILDGNTFVVSDETGDIEASLTDPTGLFSFDTRFLSQWVLTINGQRLDALSVDDLQYFETRFFLVPGTGTVYIDAKLSVIRQRSVANGFHEDLTILNHADKSRHARRSASRRARDFADLFEVKDALKKKGDVLDEHDAAASSSLGYERGPFSRATEISATSARARRQRTGSASRSASRRTVSGRRISMSSRPGSAPGRRRVKVAGSGTCPRAHGGATSTAGSPRRRASSATGTR